MRKIIMLFSVFIIGLMAVPASAQVYTVQEVIQSTVCVRIVSVSSYTATQVDVDASTVAVRNYAWLQNQDSVSTNTIRCDFTSGVTTSTGWTIAGGGLGELKLPLRAFTAANGRIRIWCISNSTSGPSSVAYLSGF